MKVRYIGYRAECNEWRPLKDIIEFSDLSNSDLSSDKAMCIPAPVVAVCECQFCLYKELRERIKSLLYANWKGDPVCTIVMTFDMRLVS